MSFEELSGQYTLPVFITGSAGGTDVAKLHELLEVDVSVSVFKVASAELEVEYEWRPLGVRQCDRKMEGNMSSISISYKEIERKER